MNAFLDVGDSATVIDTVKITGGRFQMEAIFTAASWKTPSLVAPSQSGRQSYQSFSFVE